MSTGPLWSDGQLPAGNYASVYGFDTDMGVGKLATNMQRDVAEESWAAAFTTSGGADRLAGIAGTYPSLSGGTAVSLASAGLTAADDAVKVAAVQEQAKKKDDGPLSFIGRSMPVRALKGLSRAATIALGSPYEMGQAAFRQSVQDGREGGLGGVLGGLADPMQYLGEVGLQTTAGERQKQQMIDALRTGKLAPGDVANPLKSGLAIARNAFAGVDEGSGFMAGGAVQAGQVQAARRAGLTGGHATTPGRFLANQVVEPGTKPYNTLSGVIDFGLALADPSGLALGKVGKVAKAEKVLSRGRNVEVAIPTAERALLAPGRAGAVTAQEAASGSIPIYRRAGAQLDNADDKPSGLYFSHEHEAFGYPHNAMLAEATTDHRLQSLPLNDKSVLTVQGKLLDSRGLRGLGGADLDEDAGITALRKLRGEDEFKSLVSEARGMSGKDFAARLAERYEGVDFQKYLDDGGDKWDLLSAAGGMEARKQGYKAIWAKGDDSHWSYDPDMNEYVALTADAAVARPAFVSQLPLREQWGLVDGVRKTVLPEKAADWLLGAHGRKVVDTIAAEGDFNALWKGSKGQLPVDVVVKLQDAKTPNEVAGILADELGGSVRTADGLDRLAPRAGVAGILDNTGARLRRSAQSKRLLQSMPGRHLDFSDPDDAVRNLDLFQRNVKLDEATISKNNGILARALADGSPAGAFEATKAVMSTVQATLAKTGMDEQAAGSLTKMFVNASDDLRRFNVDAVGQNVRLPGARVGASNIANPSPHLYVEYLNGLVPLPDARELRKATSAYGQLLSGNTKASAIARGLDEGVVTPSSNFLEWVTGDLFKPLALLRPAYVVRVVGEEQARMAAAGYSSVINHPMSAISFLLGDRPDSRLAKAAAKVGFDPRGGTDVLGASFMDEMNGAAVDDATAFAKAISKSGDHVRAEAGAVMTRDFTVYGTSDRQFARSWADELMQLRADPVAAKLLDGETTADQAKDWFFSGPGQKLRMNLAEADDIAAKGGDATFDPERFLARDGADDYIESVLERIRVKTGGNPDLIDALRTGQLDGVSLREGGRVSKAATRKLKNTYAPLMQDGFRVKGQRSVQATDSKGKIRDSVLGRTDMAVDKMFQMLMSTPTNTMSRSPVFRQAYWNRIGEAVGMLDAPSREAALAAAKKANLGGSTLAELRAAIHVAGDPGEMKLSHLDLLAKDHALEETRHLLYDLHDRGQFFDTYRLLVPFGEAWKEVLSRWAELSVTNPSTLYRANQLVSGARDSGFFWDDPQSGEEMFTYPGSEQMMNAITGVPFALDSQATGLNTITGQLLPGFGPVVQIPAGNLIPDAPKYDDLREIINPFGGGDPDEGMVEQFFPAWMKKVLTAQTEGYTGEKRRQFAGTTKDVADYLYSTGAYDVGTREGQEKLLSDAREKAKGVWLVRGLAQTTLPTAPSPREVALDKDGKLTTLYKLGAEYRRMVEEDSQNATANFINTYGELAFLTTSSKSSSPFTPTDALATFGRENPSVARAYPEVWGLFMPEGEFSNDAYTWELRSGIRTPTDPADAISKANSRIANARYREYQSKVGDRTDVPAQDWLRSKKAELVEQYPGWNPQENNRAKNFEQVEQLKDALNSPQLRGTDAGQGLLLYMDARDKALAAAQAGGLAGFTQANSAQPLRDWLREIAQAVILDHPDFEGIWDRILSREMINDETDTALTPIEGDVP